MATVHFFGDSFTKGHGLLEPVLIENEKNLPHWTEYIQQELGFDSVKNYGDLGFSNEVILLTLLRELCSFEEGDLVVVGQTFWEREIFLQFKPNDKITRDDDSWIRSISGDRDGVEVFSTDELRKRYLKNHDHHMAGPYTATVNYLVNTKVPQQQLWTDFYAWRFNKIGKLLNKLGIKYYLWVIDEHFPKYELISEYTKGEVEDYHWSWNGSLEFGKKLLNKLK